MQNKTIITLTIFLFSCIGASARHYITYEMFGAKGDGVTDDQKAIVAAHDAANERHLPVRVASRTYYIGGAALTAVIKTDTDFGNARFIIDDSAVEDRYADVFEVQSYREEYEIDGLKSLDKGARKLGIRLPCRSLVAIWNDNKKIYIREGLNQNDGTSQYEVLVASRSGRVNRQSKVIWQYDTVTCAVAFPVDRKTLTVKGGHFTTIANEAESRYTYYRRGIRVFRSNTVIKGIEHEVTAEADHGAPYNGFINIINSFNVKVQGCTLSGHKTFYTTGSAGKPVSMGTYDLAITSSIGVIVSECTQFDDIDDRSRWGIMGSNFCKSLSFENCKISRFDAHQGVWNVTLRDCVFGHMAARAVGSGTLRIERCEMHSPYLFALREDYGSSWDGDIFIKDCTLKPLESHKWWEFVSVIHGMNIGLHDFGYECHLPRKVVVDGLYIDDSMIISPQYKGPALFSNFDYSENATFAIAAEGDITMRGITVSTGRPFVISHNPERFKGYTVR